MFQTLAVILVTSSAFANCVNLRKAPVELSGNRSSSLRERPAGQSEVRQTAATIVEAKFRNLSSASFRGFKDSLPRTEYSKCIRDLLYVNEHLQSDWAQRMTEVTSHPIKFMRGLRITWPGDEDYCTAIRALSDDGSEVLFHGKYCLLERTVVITEEETARLVGSVCVPDSCSADDLKDKPIVRQLIHPLLKCKAGELETNVTNAGCVPAKYEPDPRRTVVICVILAFVLLAAAGTVVTEKERRDISRALKQQQQLEEQLPFEMEMQIPVDEQMLLLDKKERNPVKNFLKCFCIITNGKKIFKVENSKSQDNLQCVHGIRFLSMCWVILGHAYTRAFAIVSYDDLQKTMHLMNNLAVQSVIQGTFGVDTFFLLSGTLVGYIFLRTISANDGKMNWIYFYVHRYWRLTPTLAVVQGVYVAFVDPLLRRFLPYEEPCKWWVSLLYVNNVYDETHVCMSWVWYLANDMQFYVISPLFLYPLWRWPAVGMFLVFVFMVGSWIATAVLTFQYNLIPGYALFTERKDMLTYAEQTGEYFLMLYIKPYGRIGPYLVGILLAYALHKNKAEKRILTKFGVHCGWIIGTSLAIIVVYGMHGSNPSKIAICIYNALSRTCFAISVAWVIYACLSGHGGVVNWLLSCKAFVPLSRLTYCAYLVHPVFYLLYYDNLKTPLYINHLEMVTLYFSGLFVGYSMGFITSLLFESPMMAVEKMLMKKS